MAKTASNQSTKAALVAQTEASAKPEGMTIAAYLDRQKPAILAALPRNIDVDRFSRIVLTSVRNKPQLLSCNPMSLLAAVMQAAQLGLEPGSGLNEAHLVPYGGEVSFQMGYRGAVKLATNSGDVRAIYAEAVYKGEHFKAVLGTAPAIEHFPIYDGDVRGHFANLEAVYAVAKLSNGETQFVVMGREEIEAHRDRYSKAAGKKDSPWSDDLGAVEMAKKTVVLRLSKLLPLSAEVTRAFAADGVVRHELAPDMVMVPDVEDEKVEPAALGVEVIEGSERTATCKDCGQVVLLTEDATDEDVAGMTCKECGGKMGV